MASTTTTTTPAVATSDAATEDDADPRRWWILAVLCLSLLIVILGNTVLNVAIPTLIRVLGASDRQLQWMVDAYSLVFAGLLFTAGALGDRFGRKGALSMGLIVFGAGSLFAGVSGSSGGIIAGRAIMGLGAAFIMPSTLSILTNVFPPRERARAIGIWAGVAGAGGAIGPITSGFLLEHFWWGSIFFINIPVVLFALVVGYFLVPDSRDPEKAPLDFLGAALSVGAVASLVYGIIEAPQRGWLNSEILAVFGLAVLFGAVFAWWELRNRDPMLDLRYFRRRGFSGGSLAISMMFFGMFGMFFLLTQYLQLVKGWSALSTGVRTLPFAFTMMVAAPSSARIAERVGTKTTVVTGISIAAVGMLVMSRADVAAPYWYIVIALVILSGGMGLTMAPSTASIMSSLPLGKAGVGSAMNDTNRELGGALGVAVLGSLLASRYTHGLGSALRELPARAQEAARSSLGGAIGVAGPHSPLAGVARTSFTDAMRFSLTIGACVALLAAVLVGIILPQHLGTSEAQARHGSGEVGDEDARTSARR
jgi:EmrB/QacA subfamily drug resistance transporter